MTSTSKENSTSPQEPSHYWAIVPAAGIGTRMNADIPKQYLMLDGRTILEHTLSRLLLIPGLKGIVVAIAPNDSVWTSLSISKNPLIHSVIGGSERADSVLNALHFLNDKISGQDWVLVHDAARPCISLSSISKLCNDLASDTVGGILAVPVSDTIKNVVMDNSILHTVDRRSLWQAQTPQLFRYKLLRDCLSQTLYRKENITDEASSVELCGYTAKVVEGRSDNIKITRPDDLLLAEFILRNQKNQLSENKL
ncbi:MAG: 2-C-methyl-D-erythritol 4-phosphate cytidylyltransferase [Moraxellaceae bacterium]|nr:MAG: 2-C-methyl-D-erythritol 4-phosphate cytidylyltransferase [Moraxellaceae bacterium]